ncbi:MAG TPA: hypothetical protein VFX72_07865, partial [Usitatibacteraceae bacterium]|nr:hypothetical protein [Usitatibacteraceae bacterium]
WRRNREEPAEHGEIPWQGEGALLTRPDDTVRWIAIGHPACRFLDACSRALPLGLALEAALEADPDTNLVRLMNTLLDAGAFARLSLPTEEPCA